MVTLEDEGRLRNIAIGDSDQTAAVPSNPADTVVSTEAVSGLDVTLVAAADPVTAGAPVDWTITAQNVGNTGLTGLSLDAADASDCEAQPFPAGLDIGATATVECSTPTDDLLEAFGTGAVVPNQATVSSNEAEPVSSALVEVDVVLPPTAWTDVAAWYAPAADWLDHWDLATGFQGGTVFRGNNAHHPGRGAADGVPPGRHPGSAEPAAARLHRRAELDRRRRRLGQRGPRW